MSEEIALHLPYGHLGAKQCGRIIGKDVKKGEKPTCDECIEVRKGNISREVKIRIKRNIRLFR